MKNQRMTRVELDQLRCSDPSCPVGNKHPIRLMPRCHPDAGQHVAYDGHEGVLLVSCRQCDTFVASVVVASPHLH